MNWTEGPPTELRSLLKVGRMFRDVAGDIFLCGDVNENAGLCDCCNNYSRMVIAFSDDLVPMIDKAGK